MVGRHPFERLYSAWNDKSRTFRFPNGTYDLFTAAKDTTYLWGRSNLTKSEQGQSSKEFGVWRFRLSNSSWILLKDAILKKELRKNDVLFDPKKYGIQEESTNLDYRRKFSFSAFVNSIANSTLGRERLHDHHWMSQFYHCRVSLVEFSNWKAIIF